MAKKLLLLLPLLTGLPLFVTGALRRPPVAPLTPFTVEPITLAPELAGLPPGTLLARAVEQLAPERLAWLHVKLWQRMHDAELTFESEGTLQTGPNQCARLELTVRNGAGPGRWLVVSDGHALAQVTQCGGATPGVVCQLLAPPLAVEQPPPPPAELVLRNLGCAGPHPLLSDLRARLKDVRAQTGRLHQRPVVRLHGRLEPAADGGTAGRAEFCYLYLDAPTLWPNRLEWWAAGGTRDARLLLELEFREPQVNRPLSIPECIQAFTYKPAVSP